VHGGPEGEAVYAMLCSWWRAHGWSVPDRAALPDCGVLAYKLVAQPKDEGPTSPSQRVLPVAAVFVYRDHSCRFGMLEMLVTNPGNGARESLRAIAAVVARGKAEAKRRGVWFLFTACRQRGLARVYEGAGFTRTDEGVTHLGCDLREEEC